MMYVPSCGATIEATGSWQQQGESSLAASSNRLASRIATYGSNSVVAEPHALDLGGDPLALLGLDGEVVDVLVLDDAGDGDVQRDLLGLGEVAVRLLLLDDGQRADAEGAQLGDAGRVRRRMRVLAERASGAILSLALTWLSSTASSLSTVMPGW